MRSFPAEKYNVSPRIFDLPLLGIARKETLGAGVAERVRLNGCNLLA